jgi:hypothetical protein
MEGTAQLPRPLTCLPSMAGGPAMDEAIVVPWCWGDHRGPGAWRWGNGGAGWWDGECPRREMRRDSNALFSHIGQQGRVLVSLLPLFPLPCGLFQGRFGRRNKGGRGGGSSWGLGKTQ